MEAETHEDGVDVGATTSAVVLGEPDAPGPEDAALGETQAIERVSTIGAGTVLEGRFELESVLGEGGFGVVYRARQISTGQTVAIKLLQPDKLINTSRAGIELARFEREMQLIARLKHPNIVRLIDSGHTDDGQLYTVLEYIDGEPLSALIDRTGPMSPRDATRLMGQVMEALSCAHAQGIVHRDLKPQNIMVNTAGARPSALVLDFGISAVVSGSRSSDYRSLTATGQFQGTPSYMAPEQLRERDLTPATDLYAWGLVFLECLIGRPVIVEPSFAAIIYRQMSPDPVPIPPAVVHHAVGPVIHRACAKDLAARYASADEALADLEDLDASGPLPMALHTTGETPDLPGALATTAGPGGIATGEPDLGRGETEDAPLRAETGSDTLPVAPARNRGLIAAVAVLSVLLLGTLAWIGLAQFITSDKAGPPEPVQQDGAADSKLPTPTDQATPVQVPADPGPAAGKAATSNDLDPSALLEKQQLSAKDGAAAEVAQAKPAVSGDAPAEPAVAGDATPQQAEVGNASDGLEGIEALVGQADDTLGIQGIAGGGKALAPEPKARQNGAVDDSNAAAPEDDQAAAIQATVPAKKQRKKVGGVNADKSKK